MLHEIVKLSFLSPNGSPGTILVKTWNTDIDSCTIYFRKYLFRKPTNHCQMIRILQHSIFDILWFWFFTGWRQPQPKLPHPPQPPFLGSALPKDVVNATLTKVGQALPPLSELWPRYLQSIGGLGRYRWPPGYLVYEPKYQLLDYQRFSIDKKFCITGFCRFPVSDTFRVQWPLFRKLLHHKDFCRFPI